MDLNFFLKGLAIGFSIAAPVGPIGVLCIHRTLAEGRATGFLSGLGAATADAIYGCIAGFGVTFISSFLVNQQTWIRLIGGLFLFYLGIKTLLTKPVENSSEVVNKGLLASYISTFFLTLTNPLTILSFAAIFTGFGLGEVNKNYLTTLLLIIGVFCGSAAWWLLLSSIVGIFRKKFNLKSLKWVNILSGLVITGFGFYAISYLF